MKGDVINKMTYNYIGVDVDDMIYDEYDTTVSDR